MGPDKMSKIDKLGRGTGCLELIPKNNLSQLNNPGVRGKKRKQYENGFLRDNKTSLKLFKKAISQKGHC